MKKLSIVVPVYQNGDNIRDTVIELLSLKKRMDNCSLQLVFVDDGSTDNSYALLRESHAQHPDEIRVIKLTKNFGQTRAIKEGVRVADGDCIGIISADLQDPPDLFLEMLKLWESGDKLVIGERKERNDGKVHSYFSSLYWRFVNKFAVQGFPLGGFDFCLFDRQVKNSLDTIGERNTSIFPLIFWLGYQHSIIPYQRRSREKGKSQWTLLKRIQLTLDTVISFTYLPVRFISAMGISLSFLALIFTLYLSVKWLVLGSTVEGWTSLAVLVLGIGGVTLFSLGIIAEYLWRILDETRRRPSVVVDEIVTRNQKP